MSSSGNRPSTQETAAARAAIVGKEKITTLLVKKTRHLTLAHNFTKYLPLFKILSLLDSAGNL